MSGGIGLDHAFFYHPGQDGCRPFRLLPVAAFAGCAARNLAKGDVLSRKALKIKADIALVSVHWPNSMRPSSFQVDVKISLIYLSHITTECPTCSRGRSDAQRSFLLRAVWDRSIIA